MATTRKIITSPNLLPLSVPLSQAVQVDKTLYISGQLGFNKEGVLSEGIQAQTRQTLDNIGHILTAAGATFKHVVKVTVLFADIKDFAEVNGIYREYFTERYPARVGYQVACLPIPGALIEIEAVAIVGEINDI